MQSFQEVAVHLAFPSQVVELVLEYLYSDAVDTIHSAYPCLHHGVVVF